MIFDMTFAYYFKVPAPSAGFVGGRAVFARQFSGKGTSGEETRRGRTLGEVACPR